MKCDKLKAYSFYVTVDDDIELHNEAKSFYSKDDVDAAIAELKAMVTTDNSAVIARLEAENAELKAKLEDVQATAYAESVDAGMENRRMKRALWLTRANRAEAEAKGWYHSSAYIIKYDELHNIKGVLKGKGFKRYPKEWMRQWTNIELKCRAKAEQYL